MMWHTVTISQRHMPCGEIGLRVARERWQS
jgi:hypothetical protein